MEYQFYRTVIKVNTFSSDKETYFRLFFFLLFSFKTADLFFFCFYLKVKFVDTLQCLYLILKTIPMLFHKKKNPPRSNISPWQEQVTETCDTTVHIKLYNAGRMMLFSFNISLNIIFCIVVQTNMRHFWTTSY